MLYHPLTLSCFSILYMTIPLLTPSTCTVGVAAFAKEHESKGLGTPKVHLSFSLDSSGIVGLVKVTFFVISQLSQCALYLQ